MLQLLYTFQLSVGFRETINCKRFVCWSKKQWWYCGIIVGICLQSRYGDNYCPHCHEVRFGIGGPQRMISNDFGDLLSFPLALQLSQNLHLINTFITKTNCPDFLGICCEYSGSPVEEPFTFWTFREL